MTIRPIDNYFLQKDEPGKSCLMALRDIILKSNSNISEAWKYGMPVYCYKGKMCCYLWVHKKFKQPYIGIVEGHKVEHPKLIIEKRARMKIMLIDPAKDLPIRTLKNILKQMIALYK